jgi:ribosomal-protein-alanine N-acetyltransferase
MIDQEMAAVGGVRLVIEEAAGTLLGWCACRIMRPEAELLKIAVTSKRRRERLGEMLFRHLLDVLDGKGITALFLEVRSQNAPALRFYERYGFGRVGVRRRYYTNPEDDALILRKTLPKAVGIGAGR